jgi:Holliday junction resolvase
LAHPRVLRAARYLGRRVLGPTSQLRRRRAAARAAPEDLRLLAPVPSDPAAPDGAGRCPITGPMASNKGRGTQREVGLVKLLRDEGWVATRTPASLGTMDVIALRSGDTPRFIQVKCTQKPFAGFSPVERYDLLADALKAGARAELCWWPIYGKPEFIGPDDWPPTFQPKELKLSGDSSTSDLHSKSDLTDGD